MKPNVHAEKPRLILIQIILTIAALLMVTPFLWMVSSALKENTQVTKVPFEFIPDVIRWDNFKIIFQRAPMLHFMLNSLKVTLISVFGLLLFNTMAAYSFAKLRYKGKNALFLLFLGTMMVPSSVMLIPKYILFNYIGLIDNHLALILPAFFSSFYMFMLRQYIMGIPDELIEAARIDGTNHYDTLFRIIIPNIKPILTTVFILSFIGNWNEFMNALVYLKTVSRYTIPLGIQSFNSSHLSMRAWSSAASLVALTPLFAIFLFGLFKDKYLGIIIISIRPDIFENCLTHLTESTIGRIYIIDNNKTVLYNDVKSRIGKNIVDVENIKSSLLEGYSGSILLPVGNSLEKNLVTYNRSRKTSWTVVSIIPWDKQVTNLNTMRNTIIMFGLLLIAAGSLIAYLFSFKITNPLKTLGTQMEKVREGNFDEIIIQTVPYGEIGQLTSIFIKMVADIRQLISQVFEEQRQKRHAEFKALQSQINPHFINNTLSSLIWLISSGHKQESVDLVTSLSNLLKNSVGDVREIIPVGNELEHLMNYVEIQRIRYKSKLHVKFEIDDCIMDDLMPKFLLQPLVENSIHHGIGPKKTRGTIKIIAGKSGNDIFFKIIDNGIGMTSDKLESILDVSITNSSCHGISNVNNRIKLHYGDAYGLKFASKLGKGTLAVLCIPVDHRGRSEYV